MAAPQSISPVEIPVSPERLLADRKAQMARDIGQALCQEIPCPGGCGGTAILEAPLTVEREGCRRVFQVAQCQSSCRKEVKSRSGRIRLVPARFEVPSPDSEDPERPSQGSPRSLPRGDSATPQRSRSRSRPNQPQPPSDGPHAELSALLQEALRRSQLRQEDAAVQIGCSQSIISKALHSRPVAARTSAQIRAWAERILFPEAAREESPPPSGPKPLSEVESALRQAAPGNPYEAVLRRLLEEVTQKRLKEIAGEAARDIRVRVSLEWLDPTAPDTLH